MAPAAAGRAHSVPTIKGGRGEARWEPATHDLTVELPPLLDRFAGDGFVAVRVMFNPADWSDAPRHITLGDREVKLGAFHTQRRLMITLIDESGRTRVDVHDDSTPPAGPTTR
jgi:hypothetical protein